ncbi:hypothetical protein Hdeb2414_s0004g00150791 [Helianthus debilis subsp. tardiflorus]
MVCVLQSLSISSDSNILNLRLKSTTLVWIIRAPLMSGSWIIIKLLALARCFIPGDRSRSSE